MILPILAYGDPVLRKKASVIDKSFNGLSNLINDMFDTMDRSNGVGLAAPQVGKSIRLFVIDSTSMYDEGEAEGGIRKVFVNPQILEEKDKPWTFEEGCLSIPHIREDVMRNATVRISYQDEEFNSFTETFTGMTARVIQHEYDHIEGVLFIDHISALKRRLLKGKLKDISKGKVHVDYRMRFPKQ